MTRSMLKAKKCQRFYGEAAPTAIYILNKCLTKKIVKKTPYDKIMISKDVLMDERKVYNWIQGSIRHEQDKVKIVLEEDQ